MNWYYTEMNSQVGPVAQEEFDALVKAGKIGPETKVWRDGMHDWTPYRDLAYAPGMPAAAAIPAMPAAAAMPLAMAAGAAHRCAECGNTFAEGEMIPFENAWVCAACKPVFVQKLKEGITPAGVLNYAGFWIRAGAYLIDFIILEVANFCVGLVIGLALRGGPSARHAAGIATFFGFVFGVTYMVYFNGRFGATPGKMALKLKIVRPNGDGITYMRALGRYFAEILSGMIFSIGFMMAGWDEEKRALHDRICDTRVIRL